MDRSPNKLPVEPVDPSAFGRAVIHAQTAAEIMAERSEKADKSTSAEAGMPPSSAANAADIPRYTYPETKNPSIEGKITISSVTSADDLSK